MEKKNKIDAFGAVALISFSLLLGINHVVIKIVNVGLNPIFFAGIRSFIAFLFIIIWMKFTRKPIVFNKKNTKICLIAGLVFALEFLFLFLALDFTSVSRNYKRILVPDVFEKRQELSNDYLLLSACKNRLRCSRERVPESLPKCS